MKISELPFMHEKESDFISSYLHPEATMLEWGSGGSTLFFSKLVKEYHSIEHDEKWSAEVQKKIKENNLDNVEYYYVPSSQPWERPRGWRQIPNYPGTPTKLFKDYIDVIDKIDKKFDFILVDGRCRVQCGIKALPFLKDDGILFFHDFYPRKQFGYHNILHYYDDFDRYRETPQTVVALKKKKSYQNNKKVLSADEIIQEMAMIRILNSVRR